MGEGLVFWPSIDVTIRTSMKRTWMVGRGSVRTGTSRPSRGQSVNPDKEPLLAESPRLLSLSRTEDGERRRTPRVLAELVSTIEEISRTEDTEGTEDGEGVWAFLANTSRDHSNVHEANLDGRARLRPNRGFPAVPRTTHEPLQRNRWRNRHALKDSPMQM
jgi:hypothetical protein